MQALLRLFCCSVSTGRRSAVSQATRRLSVEPLDRREVCAAMADLIAYRPVTAAIDYSKYAVPESVETDLAQGPGIRINGDDDNRNGVADRLDKTRSLFADNDLVRVDVRTNTASNRVTWIGSLAVWTSANKQAAISNGQTVSPGQKLWVEYVGTAHSSGANTSLTLTSTDRDSTATDTVVFHTFQSEVVAIGGALQSPIGQQGVFEIAVGLYQQGYDVHLFRNIAVNKQGTGADLGVAPAYGEVNSAIRERGVSNVALVGMSYGGGAVHDLAAALENTPALRGHLQYTAYIDAIVHYSIPPVAERRLPPGTTYHDNIFQTNDWLIRGDTVNGASRNINASSWRDSRGAKLKHITIDRNSVVQNTISTGLRSQMSTR